MTIVPLEVTTTTDNCRYCLMCRHVCPVGHVTHLETLTPHGWGLTISSVKRGLLEWNETTVSNLYMCADCGGCRSHCVNDQPLPDAIASARQEVVETGKAPDAVYEVRKMLEDWGNPFREEIPLESAGAGEDAIFIGDEARFLWPEALESARILFGALGMNPVEIGAGRESGFLASSLGLLEAAQSSARRTLDELAAAGARRMFVFSAGDYYTFNQLFSERLGIPWPEEVELAELSTFLYENWQAGDLEFNPSPDDSPYAYVDPSHAVRALSLREAPRRLIGATFSGPARELFWRRDRAHPVGSTALRHTHPDLAQRLTHDRLQDARQSGVELLICEDPATLAELSRFAAGYDLQVRGLYEVLAEQLAV